MFDYWGNELKRYYRLDALAAAMEHMVQTGDRFFLPTVQSVLGQAPISRLVIALFQEGRYQLIFRVLAENVQRRRASFGLVVAKNHLECSKVAKQEHRNLHWMHARAPKWVVKPYMGGEIFLPGRGLGGKSGREIYAYLTQWLNTYDELGVNDDLQFFTNVVKRHTFSKTETEKLKGVMTEIIACVYDPDAETSMTMPEIASGDFVVERGNRGEHRLRLIACRRIVQNVNPAALIRMILNASWGWGEKRFQLAPESPHIFVEGLTRAVGRGKAHDWLGRYVDACESGLHRPPSQAYVDVLRKTVGR